ncbi:MAG: NAD-dependent epimerase/dehydratase family protein [Candidatus Cyclobacteriaceae bacterium M2_1C_046]
MKILVTGGAGYIGTELVRRLVKFSEVESVTVYDNLSRGNFNFFIGDRLEGAAKVKFIQGELLDSRALKKALAEKDVVYHLAAKVTTPFANTDPHFFEQVNHWGTAELVYAVESLESVKKFIYTSSLAVYGSSTEQATEETYPNPRTFYGTSKLRGEEHIQRLSSKIDTYIIRCGNVYGYSPSIRFDAVINKFVFESHFNKLIQIHGDGKQSRGFIHIDLLSSILAQLVKSPLPKGTYNAVHRNLQVLDIVDKLKQLIPELEFLFINQHLKLREIKGEPNKQLLELAPEWKNSFKEELEYFLGCFRF